MKARALEVALLERPVVASSIRARLANTRNGRLVDRPATIVVCSRQS